MSLHNDHLVLALQHEKQAIFDTDVPQAEQHRLWSRRKAEVEAFLASDRQERDATTHHDASLARTTSNVGLTGLAETGPGRGSFSISG